MKNKIISLTLALCLTLMLFVPAISPVISYAAEETIYIYTTEDFINFAKKCSYDVWSKSKTVILENDISLLGVEFESIPTFGGCFDGNGKTVSGLDIQNSHAPAGLFATLENGGVIKNLTVQGSVCPDGERSLVGGIVGNNFGQIEGCTFIGTVVGKTDVGGIAGANGFSGSITDCKTNATVIGETRTGGIAGINQGFISSSSSSSFVNTICVTPSLSLDGLDISLTLDINKLTSINSINMTDAGGIAGYSTGMILNCDNIGKVGYPHVGYNVGGIAGRSCGHLSGNTNRGEIYGRKDVGGIVGQIEPHISYNLSEDHLASLKSELDNLSSLVNGAVNNSDGSLPTISGKLDNILDGIDDASDSLENIMNGATDLGNGFVSEINRFSDILSAVLYQLSEIGEDVPELSELIGSGLGNLENALDGLEEISTVGIGAISDLNLMVQDASSAFGKLNDAMENIDTGLSLLESALTVEDKEKAKEALANIADGLGEAVRACDSVANAFGKITDVMDKADWLSEAVVQFREIAEVFQDMSADMSDLYDATTAIKESIDINWELLIGDGNDDSQSVLSCLSSAIGDFTNSISDLSQGLGNIKSGLEKLLAAFETNDNEEIEEAKKQITNGMNDMLSASIDFSAALLKLSESLESIDSIEDLSVIGESLGSLATSATKMTNAMVNLSNGITVILSNANFDLLTEGGAEIIDGIGGVIDALVDLSKGMANLNDAINLANQAVSITDEAKLKEALDKAYTALGGMIDATGELASIMIEMADTMEKALKWSDSLIDAVKEFSDSISSVTGALVKVQDGVDSLRENISFDENLFSDGLTKIREGLNDLKDSFGFIESSLLHLSDALTKIDDASERLPEVITSLKNAMADFSAVSEIMVDMSEKVNSLLGYLKDVDPIQFPTVSENLKAEAGKLFASISLIESELKSLNADLTGLGEDLVQRIGKINKIFDKISDSISDMIYGLNDNIIDNKVTEAQIDSVTNGKIFSCVNYGSVYGDINVGGIGGVIGLEFALDPEDDNTAEPTVTQKKLYSLKAVIHASKNFGNVTSKYDAAGGVVGKMDFGLIYGCEAYSVIQSESGNYVGGIAGITAGLVSQCFVKSTLSGGKYVGGIVGAGVTEDFLGDSSMVRNNYSMVEITAFTQYAGAISGANIGQYSENLFISDTLSGIDRISYVGKAEAISYEELIKRRSIPDEFYSFIIKFVADGIVISTMSFKYGELIDDSVFPTIPVKDGYYGRWDTQELGIMLFDRTVNAVYKPYVTTLSSESKRDDGREIFFVIGEFTDESKITVSNTADTKGLVLSDKLFTLDKLVEVWTVDIPTDNLESNRIHFLAENENCRIFIKLDGVWQEVEAKEFGSYLLFTATGDRVEIAVIDHTVKPLPIIILSIAALALIGTVTTIIIIKKKKAKA